MPREREPFFFTYETIAEITGQTLDTVRQHAFRGKFDPANLETVIGYCFRYGNTEMRHYFIECILGPSDDPTPPRRKRSSKKTR